MFRQSIKKRKKALGRQLCLFDMGLETHDYRYGIWVTNMTEDPLTAWLRLSASPQACRAKIQDIMDRIAAYSMPNSQLHCS